MGIVYICTRTYVNVSQSYLPLYLTETMRFEKVRGKVFPFTHKPPKGDLPFPFLLSPLPLLHDILSYLFMVDVLINSNSRYTGIHRVFSFGSTGDRGFGKHSCQAIKQISWKQG